MKDLFKNLILISRFLIIKKYNLNSVYLKKKKKNNY